MQDIRTRAELLEILAEHRVFVGTVASVVQKPELFELKNFKRVVIDEASQILEPHLVGLLSKFDQFILIGDHKQLPAVVTQDQKRSDTNNMALQKIGLYNLRHSLFERLYNRAKQNGWEHAYAQLRHQGRMHEAIMDFPSSYFYEGELDLLPSNIPHRLIQTASLAYDLPPEATVLHRHLVLRRVLFFNTPIQPELNQIKTNQFEARMVRDLVLAFQDIYNYNEQSFHRESIGVITPYRAQIACIKNILPELPFDVTVDTVERYQGGARDIIILSLCTNRESQLHALVSQSADGIDRKLNVALTRARKHLIIMGNTKILNKNSIYKELISQFSVDLPTEMQSQIT